jgi:hypothetical protein
VPFQPVFAWTRRAIPWLWLIWVVLTILLYSPFILLLPQALISLSWTTTAHENDWLFWQTTCGWKARRNHKMSHWRGSASKSLSNGSLSVIAADTPLIVSALCSASLASCWSDSTSKKNQSMFKLEKTTNGRHETSSDFQQALGVMLRKNGGLSVQRWLRGECWLTMLS